MAVTTAASANPFSATGPPFHFPSTDSSIDQSDIDTAASLMSASNTSTVPSNTKDNADLEAAKISPSPIDKSSRRQRLKPGFTDNPPFSEVVKRSWLDVLTQLLCIAGAYLIYLFATPLLPRQFPLYEGIHKSSWGMKHGKPFMSEYINTNVSAVVSFVGPFLVIGAVGLRKVRSFWDTHTAVSATSSFTGS
jgi:diacylglycerol diphosphate phosphatase/phosphatidate phosphatase